MVVMGVMVYVGILDYFKVILDKVVELGVNFGILKVVVGGGVLFLSLC